MQVLVNLLSNSLKFTIKGFIKIKIDVELNHTYKITVQDTGIGIKDEDKSKLFKTFAKVDAKNQTRLNAQGCGLGLTIANSLAQLLGPLKSSDGVQFKSDYGFGSQFWFYVQDRAPAITSDDIMISFSENTEEVDMDKDGERDLDETDMSLLSIASEKKEVTLPYFETVKSILTTSPGKTQTTCSNSISKILRFDDNDRIITQQSCKCPEVLIIDDDGFNQVALEMLLKKFKLKCKSVYSGPDALIAVHERDATRCCKNCDRYRYIFVDSNMPIMCGEECIMKLVDYFDQSKIRQRPKLVVCSAYEQNEIVEKNMKAGADYYLSKPVFKDKLETLFNQMRKSLMRLATK